MRKFISFLTFQTRLLACTGVCLLASCSLARPHSTPHGTAPYDLTVEETKNDGHLLQILAKISSGEKPLVLDDGYLQLKGLNGVDQKIARVIKINDSFLPRDKANVQVVDGVTLLAPQSSVRCIIDIPSANLSDYQLSLLWMDPPSGQITIEDTVKDGDGCGSAACEVTYTVDATLVINRKNPTNKSFIRIALGVIQKAPGIDLKGLIPENEDEIQVPVGAADDSGSVPLRVKVVKKLPQGSADNYVATLRIADN